MKHYRAVVCSGGSAIKHDCSLDVQFQRNFSDK
jgi:hypothetical protein